MRKSRFDWIWIIFVVWLGTAWAWASEPGCYRTAADAVTRAGVRGTEGYRMASAERDAFSGITWALVKSCGHPERPGVLLLAPSGTSVQGSGTLAPAARILVMQAGSRVLLVEVSEQARIEMFAVAQSSGGLGDRVRVRLLPLNASDGGQGDERFATGIVRGETLVEVEAP